MKEFIDKTATVDGTDINRANLMAIQGFIGNTFQTSGTAYVMTNSNNEILRTTILGDGTIKEEFIGEKTITKITTIGEYGLFGSITEEIVND